MLFLLLSAVVSGGLGGFILWHNPRNENNRALSVFILAIALWAAGLFFIFYTQGLFAAQVTVSAGLLICAALLYAALVFPSGVERPLPRALLIALTTGVVLGLSFFPTLLFTSPITIEAGAIQVERGPLTPFYLMLLFLLVSSAVAVLGYKWRHERDAHKKQQLSYLLLGIGTFLAGAVIADVVLPFFGIYTLNGIGPLFSLIMTSTIVYAIVRHQLMDIRVIIQRGTIYSILLSLLSLAYVGALSLMGYVASERAAPPLSAALVMLAGIFAAPPLERYFRRKTDALFFKDKYDYGEALRTLSEVLYTNIDMEDLVARAEEVLGQILRTSEVRILPVRAKMPGAVLRIPIESEGKRVGTIALGQKRSGDPYSSEDVQLLETFAYQAATAFSRALLTEEVRQHAQQLEQKVAERTLALSRSQETQRQMMVDISHNLQTPLTVVQIKLEQLRKRMPGNADLTQFEKSLGRLSTFIYDLLKLARLEHGSGLRSWESVALSPLVHDVVEEVSVIASSSGIHTQSSIEPNLYCQGDAEALREAALNLLSNAIKYMGDGTEKKITVELKAEDATLSLTISDTGMGISQEELPHIFERFYRSPSQAKEGTGLGLAITKQIIEMHGGTIAAESLPGRGSIFIIHLPLLVS